MAADVGHSEAVSTAAKKSGYESNFNILWSRKQERPRVKQGHKKVTMINNERDDDEAYKIFAKNKQYLEAYEDMHKLRKYMYDEYMERLQHEVDEKRKKIYLKSEKARKLYEAKEIEQKKASHVVKRSLERHTLKQDDNFLNNVKKSNMYNLIALYDKKVEDGTLKSQTDRDMFWLTHGRSTPHNPAHLTSAHASGGRNVTMLSESNVGKTRPRPHALIQIEESRESRNTARSETSATGGKAGGKSDPAYIARQAAADLDRQYPELAVPTLYCFTDELDDKPRDPKEIIAELESKQHEQQRKTFVGKLRKMYNLAQSNNANMHRMLARRQGDFDMLMKGASLPELIPMNEHVSDHGYHEDHDFGDEELHLSPEHTATSLQRSYMTLTQADSRRINRTSQDKVEEMLLKTASSDNMLRRKSQAEDDQLKHRSDGRKTTPLQVDDLLQSHKQMEASCLSTLWSNYLQLEAKQRQISS